MRTDVIVKTWWNDLCWVSYALKFLLKNWKEPNSNFIVLADENCHKVIKTWGFPSSVKYYYFRPWPDGNGFQQYLTFLSDTSVTLISSRSLTVTSCSSSPCRLATI